MTDLFRGYDLTTVADKVAKAHYERMTAREESPTPWHDLAAMIKHRIKSDLLPIVTDVLDALEDDQVRPTEATQMVEYGFDKGDRTDPRWYENQHPLQHDVTTATVWCLHLHVHPSVKDAVLERMSVMPEVTGEYTYNGDSWREWGTDAVEFAQLNGGNPDHDQHLAVYFHATPERAAAIGYHLANHATFAAMQALGGDNANIEYHVSTSGDYAEQIKPL